MRAALGVTAGDRLCREIEAGVAKVSKVVSSDREWSSAVCATLADEWLSDEDDEGYRDL